MTPAICLSLITPRIEAIDPARALGHQIARGYAASKMSCHAGSVAGDLVHILGQKKTARNWRANLIRANVFASPIQHNLYTVIFLDNVFNLEVKNYTYGRGKL
jgi:hypothetical protein